VQRLRAQADAAGNLKSSPQINVVKESQTIVIEPANPQVIYVPQYNPTVVYGAWPYPAYPPAYIAPVPGSALAAGIAFGAGVAITAAIWNNHYNHYPSWNSGSININNSRNVNINRNAAGPAWQHNVAHRGGVAYRDTGSQQKYAKNIAGSDARQQYRGRDATPQQMPARGNSPAGIAQQQPNGRAGAATAGSGARAEQRASESPRVHPTGQVGSAGQRDPGAFARAGNGAQAQRDFDRGRASQQSMASHRAQGGGAGAGGGRTGGGGGRAGGSGGGARGGRR
jgi:hypothetical protein